MFDGQRFAIFAMFVIPRPKLSKIFFSNSDYMALFSETAFQKDFGPQEVPEPEKSALSLSDWGTSRGPKSVLKAVSLKSAI